MLVGRFDNKVVASFNLKDEKTKKTFVEELDEYIQEACFCFFFVSVSTLRRFTVTCLAPRLYLSKYLWLGVFVHYVGFRVEMGYHG